MSLLQLLCTHLHPAVPALTTGIVVALHRDDSGGIAVTVPGTPEVLTRVARAVKDGALVLTDPSDPTVRELERIIREDAERLLAQADALVASDRLKAAG